ncbi:glutamyl-tRNA reductase [Microbacterium sp. zg.B48]|uniref:glutamyl-tRNA reductase n=1 Tax=unclassified Microbacterium TaxID=2609290 RepID=UPI00214BA18A|nr:MULTISPECIES: glutamyl-tRNA reductase [unclassified Microbacterium]MCR2765039.1 glutamyl-tRNA reductase [Microbacterium sp. zg.B48]MCR2811217.1 glutamyl-tRNA reductase [Microbacterium sp. zg.B185]WIM19816.1 glutamyl-tRNA reductase [Microbacterium sp. zg-B185]
MLLCVSVSHRTADFDLLGRLSEGATAGAATTLLADGRARGAVLVSTCNRVEAYLDVVPGADTSVAEATLRTLAATADLPHDVLREGAQVLAGAPALHHLFAVTSGLESLAVGEEEIAGQVRRAYEAARESSSTTPELDTAFQRAAKVSRDVRSATALGKAGRSLVQFALQLAGTRLTDWRQTRVLIVGTGNYAATTVAALRTLGVSRLSVYSLTGRAEMFADRYGVRPERGLRDAVADADVVITCTNTYSLSVEEIPDDSRRTIIDLGLPRNVDPAVGRLPGIDLMDLELIATHARLPKLAPDATARQLVSSAADAFAAEQTAAPAIVALRSHVFDALDSELARLASRSVAPEHAAAVTQALRHFAGALLHDPTQRARELAARGQLGQFEAGLAAVFGIDPARAAGTVTPLRPPVSDSGAAESGSA